MCHGSGPPSSCPPRPVQSIRMRSGKSRLGAASCTTYMSTGSSTPFPSSCFSDVTALSASLWPFLFFVWRSAKDCNRYWKFSIFLQQKMFYVPLLGFLHQWRIVFCALLINDFFPDAQQKIAVAIRECPYTQDRYILCHFPAIPWSLLGLPRTKFWNSSLTSLWSLLGYYVAIPGWAGSTCSNQDGGCHCWLSSHEAKTRCRWWPKCWSSRSNGWKQPWAGGSHLFENASRCVIDA